MSDTNMEKIFVFLMSFSLSLFVIISIIPVKAQPTVVMISPASQNVSDHSRPIIIVNVSISDVTGLYGFQFDVSYDQNVLELAQQNKVTEGDFLKSDGASTFWIFPNISTHGLIDNTASARYGVQTGMSGSGNLAQIRFVIDPGFTAVPASTEIGISNVKLSDINNNSLEPFQVNNGTINIEFCVDGETKTCGSPIGECQTGIQTCFGNDWGSCQGSVGPSAETCDGEDDDCDGYTDNAVIDDPGPLTQACSVNYQGICAVGTETCTSGNWSGCPSPLQEICWDGIDQDCNGADSQCEGDIAPSGGDGCIDIQDLAAVALDFGKTSGFDPAADINNDGEVDIFDLVIVAKDFGSGCS